jgi:hypothetical protein
MKSIKSVVVLLVAIAVLAGCTASVRVMPNAEDSVRVVARDIEKHKAEKAAFKAAVAYCEDSGQQAEFVSESVKYEGSMDEDVRTSVRNHSKAASVLGGIVRVADHHDAALVFEGAGAVGTTVTSGKDYTAEVKFRCKS